MVQAVNSDSSFGGYNNNNNQTKFFKINGYVAKLMNDEKMFYLACPDCKKKVTEDIAGWRCESCGKIQHSNVPTYMLTAKIADVSGTIYVQFLREMGDHIMNGMSAKDFKDLKEDR